LSGCDSAEPIQLRFKLQPDADAARRVQFYVYDVELLQDDSSRQPLALTTHPVWQSERVALLDLAGPPQSQRREVIVGRIAPGSYNGVRFSLGVPFELNHGNQLTAEPPLNRPEMFWSWQSGYKFLRIELTDAEHAGAFHLGSTGCSSASALRPPQQPCAQPNVIRVELRGFDPRSHPIVVDVSEIAAALTGSEQRACTGEYEQPACAAAYAVTGLEVATGRCAGAVAATCSRQRLFTVAK
jgi:uncharacterized repeat protein (TIGR04052 family)